MQLSSHKPLTKGYTLIELLVGITIISLVFGVGYAGFREFSRRQALQGSIKKVTSDLRFIQQQALTGEKPEVGCDRLNGYTFTVASSTTYNLLSNCDAGDSLISTRTMDTGVEISATTASTKFLILGKGTDLAGDNVITLTHIPTGNTAEITIGAGGEIK